MDEREDLTVKLDGIPVVVNGRINDETWIMGTHFIHSFITELVFEIEEGDQLLILHDIMSTLKVNFKGIMTMRHIIGESGLKLYLMYECVADGDYLIQFMLEIPPYESLKISWMKH